MLVTQIPLLPFRERSAALSGPLLHGVEYAPYGLDSMVRTVCTKRLRAMLVGLGLEDSTHTWKRVSDRVDLVAGEVRYLIDARTPEERLIMTVRQSVRKMAYKGAIRPIYCATVTYPLLPCASDYRPLARANPDILPLYPQLIVYDKVRQMREDLLQQQMLLNLAVLEQDQLYMTLRGGDFAGAYGRLKKTERRVRQELSPLRKQVKVVLLSGASFPAEPHFGRVG